MARCVVGRSKYTRDAAKVQAIIIGTSICKHLHSSPSYETSKDASPPTCVVEIDILTG